MNTTEEEEKCKLCLKISEECLIFSNICNCIHVFYRPPPIPTTKGTAKDAVLIFECPEGELDYEQDVPGKMTEPLENGQVVSDVAWEIRMKCNKKTRIVYGPWADRQR